MSNPPPSSYSNFATPTLALQITFYLLGTHNVPTWMYNYAQRRTKPLEILCSVFNNSCSDVPIAVWAREAPPVLEDAVAVGTDMRRAELESQATQSEDEQKSRWEEVSKGWVLRRADPTHDGALTAAEKKRLGPGVWSAAVVLQRFGIPVS